MLRSVAAPAQTELDLLTTTLTPGAIGTSGVGYAPPGTGSLGADSFYYRGFTYQIRGLRARSVAGLGNNRSHFCLRFASPYVNGLRHRASLVNLTLRVRNDAYALGDALQEGGANLCWYPRVAFGQVLEAGVATTLRITTAEMRPVLSIATQPRNGDTYLKGETLRFRLSTGDRMRVRGQPTLALNIGGEIVAATARVGRVRPYVDFTYTVAEGDVDTNGVSVAANLSETGGTLQLNGGSLLTANDSIAFLEFSGLPDQAGHKVNGDLADTTPPALASATVQYRKVWLDYDEPLDRSRTPGTGQFTVTVDGAAANIESVGFGSDRRLVLTLQTAVDTGDTVLLSSTATIRDLSRNTEASPPADYALVNRTPAMAPTLVLSVNKEEVVEGEEFELTATLSQSVGYAVSVPLSVSPPFALRDLPSRIGIPAGETEVTIPVTTNHLATRAYDIEVTIGAGETDFYSGRPEVTFTALDQDASYRYQVRPFSNLGEVVEGASNTSIGVNFKVSAVGPSAAPPGSVAFQVHTEGQTATRPGDFAAVGRLVEILPEGFTFVEAAQRWEALISIEVQILADNEPEGDETFDLTLSSAPGRRQNVDFCGSGQAQICRISILITDDDVGVRVGLEARDGSQRISTAESSGEVEVDFVGFLTPGLERGPAMEFRIAAEDGSANLPADYGFSGATGASTTVRIGAADWVTGEENGEILLTVRKPIRFDITDDQLDENQEEFGVRLGEPVDPVKYLELIAGKRVVTVAIEDDDERGVIVSPTLLELLPGETGSYQVNLGSQPTGTVTVTLAGPDHGDLEASPPTLTFTADSWRTAQAVSVEATDGFLIPDEATIDHEVTGADYAGFAADSVSVRATNADDTDPLPQLGIADASAGEDDGTMSFEVTLSAASSDEVTVRYATEEGTAEADADFTAASGTVTFAAGVRTATIEVTLLDDSSDEMTEQFQVTLSNAVNAEIDDDTADAEIEDDDEPPTASVRGGAAYETSGELGFTVSLSAPSSFDVTMRYETVELPVDDGGATEGTDYEATAGALTIAPGVSAVRVNVPILSDSLHEPDETVGLALTRPTNAVFGTNQANAIGTIQDDDDPPRLTVTGGTATEADGSIPFTFELSEVSGLAVVVPYETQDETATAGADYQSSSGSLTVAAGQTQETLRVPLYRDVLTEPDETFGLLVDEDTLVGATYREAVSDPVATIRDSPGPGLTVGDAIATEVSGTIRFPVRVLGTNASAVTVSWMTRDGTAVAGSDYTAASGTLTIPAETREADITVTLLTDQTAERDETFSVVLSNASGAALIDATAVGTITEGALPVMNVAAAQASEGAPSLTFTVSLSEAGTNEIRANYRTSEVTATEDEDYTETSGVLTFAPSDLSKEVIVPILADSFDEADETLLLTLSGIRNATLGASPATGTIQDDDDAPTVSISDAEATEGGILTFEVGLSAPSRRQVTVAYETIDGTASEPDDYTAAEGTLTFAPGDTARQIRVSLQQDSTYEPSETLSVGLKSPVNAPVPGEEDGSAKGTILDDDVRAVVVNPSELTVPEGGERSYTVVLSTQPAGSVTVAIAVEGNTDVSTHSSTLTFTTQNWNTAQEVMVSAAEDGDRESETATIRHMVSGADYAAVQADSVAVEVTDGDTASTVIALSVEPKTVTESGGAQAVVVKAALNGATLLASTVVTVTVQGDTATVTDDFAPVSAFNLTIPAEAAEATRTFTLTPVDDDIDEGESETVSLTGATATPGLTVRATKVTITDDDERGVTVRPRSLTVAENSTGQYTVVLESEPTGNVTVTLAKSGSDAVTVPATPLTFTSLNWATAQTVTVTAASDVDADNEEATVAHAVTGADYAGEPADSVQVTVADEGRLATTIALSAAPSVLDEDGGATPVVITAALDGATRTAPIVVTVEVGAAADRATEGTDYGPVSDFTMTIASGAVSGAGTFTLTPMNDLVAEGDEVISVIGTTTAVDLTVTGTVVTLADDDESSGRITLSANPDSVSEGGSATAITVIAALDGATRTEATAVTVSVGVGTDSATEGTDYQVVSDFTVTIPATMSSGTATFTLTPEQDLVGEGDERISVVGAAASFAVTGARVTLTDDETLATGVTLSTSPTSVGEDDQPTVVSVTATLNDAIRSTATAVTVSVGDRGDGATEGSDYALVADFTVTIPPAMASGTGTFTLEPTQDTLGEGDESISVGGRATDLTVTGTAMTLTDAETVSTTVTLSVEPATVGEEDSATDVVVTAELDEDSRGSATAVTVAVGNAGDGATEGTDYQVVGDLTVMIPAGMTSGTRTFTLTPRDDDLNEGDEDISLVGTTTAAGLSVTGARVTITDDESAPMTIALSVQPQSVPENGGAQTVTVVATLLDGGAFVAATVVTVEVGDTGDGATEGTDYGAVGSFSLTIAGGARRGTGTFRLTPVDDLIYEGTESVSVKGTTTVPGITVNGTELMLADSEIESMKVLLSADPVRVGEEDSATAVMVTAALDGGVLSSPTAVTVQVGAGGGSATEGTDYATVSDFTVTIGAGATSGTGTFTLTPTQDSLGEGDETISVGGSTTVAELTVRGTELTLVDDETSSTVITLSANPAAVGEGDSATAVAVTAVLNATPRQLATAVTVAVGAGTDSATEGTDYQTVSDFTVTIGAGATSGTGTFTLTPTQDSLGEVDESITVGGTATGLTVTGTSLTLEDDETVSTGLTLSVNPASVGEADGATAVVVTAALDGGAREEATAVTVAVGDGGDGATEGTDYATVPDFTVTIGAGAPSGTGTFTLTPTQDALGEVDESITVGGTATGLTVTGASLTLEDDETVSTAVTLSVNPASVGEADGATAVVVTAALDGGARGEATAVTVAVGDGGDGATEGTDYATVSDFTVTIGAGAPSGTGTFTLTPTQDALGEVDESITVGGTATGLTVTGTSLTLEDDETVSTAVTLSVNPASVGEADGATAVVVTAALDGGAREEATAVTVAVGDGGDGATEGTDYATVPDFTVTIGAGAPSGTGTFTLTPTQDALGEVDESITVGGTATGLTVTGASLTLEDDETVSTAVTLSVNPASVGEADGATAVVVTAALDGGARGEATAVTVAVGDGGDGATEGTDYATVSDFTVTIGAGAPSGTGTFTLTPTQDIVGEVDESITVGGTATGLTVTGASLTLEDDETVSTAVTLSVNPASVGEADGATAVVVTAALDGGARGEATAVTVAVGDGGDGATEGTDYATVSDFTVTIGAGAPSGTGTFTLTPTQDIVGEVDESITVGGTATDLTVTGTALTLTDDETVSTGLTLSVNPASVGEADGATAVVVTAALDGGALGSATVVTVAVGKAGDSATEGTDYATVSDFTVTIGAGAPSGTGTFTLTPTQDSLGEGDESITVGGTATDLTVMGTSLTLTDDETVSTGLTLSVNPASVGEADGATAVVVTAALNATPRQLATAVTVAVGGAGDGATEGTDYATVSDFTVTIGAGATSGTGTFTLTPTQDALGEGDETISVGGSTTVAELTVRGTELTLVDDETSSTVITLSANPAAVGEGDSATAVAVTAVLNATPRQLATAVTVAVGDGGDGAAEGTDYQTVSDFTVTIGAGATSGTGTFTLTPTQDSLGEGDESITVGGTATGLTVTGTSLTLEDDETVSTGLTLSVNPASVGEADGATAVVVTAALNATPRQLATAVTVAVGDAGDGATEGTDYQAVSDFTVTIGAGATSGTGTFTLTPTQDALGEGDETISVGGSTTVADLTVRGTELTLVDDETSSTVITLSANPAAVGEGDSATAVAVTAVLNATPRQLATAVTVAVGAGGDGATEGTDYQAVSDFTVTIGAGATSGTGTFTLTPTQDLLVEGDETISVKGTATGLTVTGASLTLEDDETASTEVTLSVNPASVGEADGATAVVVTAALDGAALGSATAVTVAVGAGTDSATEGTDYQAVSDFTVTIGADATSGTGTFTLTPTQDLVSEGDEAISVEGTTTIPGLVVTGTALTLTDNETISTGVTLSVNPTSVGEADGATAVVVTAALHGAARGSATAVTVAVGDTGDSATEGTDYATVSDFTVTIGANATSGTGTFTLTPTQDLLVEGDETISVKGTATGLTVTGASLTLTDDETASMAVRLSVNPASVGEADGATAVVVTATLSGAVRGSATAVTVAVGDGGDSATEGTDYATVSDFTVTIGANATSGTGTFTLTPTQDVLGEGDESIQVGGTASGLTVTAASLTLTDDETASMAVTLSVNPASVGEADAATAVVVTAALDGGARGSATAVTVAVGDTGDSATEGTDYQTVSNFTVTIGANATSGTGTFTLTPTQDLLVEGDETISVKGTATGLTVTGASLTLEDDETASTGLTLSVNPTSVGEADGATAVVVTATLHAAALGSATAVTVAVGDTGDSATEGTDYATVSNFTVTIGANAPSGTGTFTLTPTQDLLVEGDETISVKGTATGLTVTGASLTLEDDETASTEVTLSVNPTSVGEADGATAVVVTAALHGGARGEATAVTVAVGAGTDSATEGTDYATVSNFTVTIGANAPSGTGTFTLTPTQDLLVEGDETISVKGTATGLTVTGASLTLEDDETASTEVTLSVNPTSVGEADGATAVVVTAALDGAALGSATAVTVAVGDTGDSATEGTDYATVSNFTVTIGANAPSGTGTFTLTPTQDLLVEGDETISVKGTATGLTVTGASLTLEDDETASTAVTLSVNPTSVGEADAATAVVVTAALDGGARGSATAVTVAVGDTGDSATEGTDYQTVSNFTVTIGANATSGTGTFTLTPTQDLLVEGDETISVKGTATGLTVTGASLTLEDDETASTGLTLSVNPTSVGEADGATAVVVTATLHAAALGSATAVTVAVGDTGDSATEGTDYATVSNFTVTIGANAPSGTGTFTLTPTQDLLVEGDETISVKGTATGLTVTGASLTLEDDETASTGLTLSVNPTSVGEADGATAVVVTAALDGAALGSATAVTVAVGYTGDSATEGTDYQTVSNFTVTIGANATSGTGTFTLTPTQDVLGEGSESITVGGTATGLTVTGTSLTLTDDETISTEVTLSVNPASVAESASATAVVVTATLSGGARGAATAVTVAVGDVGDRATEGTDYQTVSDFTVTIGAGATSGTGTFTLTPTQDTLGEGDETITVGGTATGLTVTGASVTLIDDETISTGVTLSVNPSSVAESASATAVVVTAALGGAARGSATAVTVAVGAGTDSATEGTDYATVSDFTVTIDAGATSGTGTFTLTPTQDSLGEGDEAISVGGSTTVANLTVSGTEVTLEDDETASTEVTLSVNPTSVGEADGATAVVVTAALDGGAPGSATAVTVAVGAGTDGATEGTDYATVSDFTVTIGAGATSGTGTFTLTPTQDVLAEGDETISVEGTATGLTVTGTSVTLTDDETVSTEVTLSVDPASVGEEDSATAVVVTAALDGGARGSATAVTVAVGDAGDSATEGTDYATVPDFTVTIGASSTSVTGTFTLTPTQDVLDEGDESIQVGGTATGLTVTGASLTLTDDDTASTGVTLSVDPASVGEEDSATAVVVTAALDGGARGSATAVTVAVGDAADSATEGTDYATVSDFTVTIGANATSGTGTFTLTPTQDPVSEGDETISVEGTATGLTVTGASLTLTDDEPAAASTAVTLSVDPTSVGEADSATAVVVTAALNGAARGSATAVTVAVGDAADSATEGTDYATVSDFTVTIGANATSVTGTFTLTPTQDVLDEGDESIQVGGTATGLTVTAASLTLTDDDTASTAVTLSVDPTSVGEADSATAVVVTAALNGAARGSATAVTVAVGDAADSATDGTDYATVSDFTVTIGANATSVTGTFTLTPTQDVLDEGDESIQVGGTATGLTVTAASLTLTDDDTASTAVTLSVDPASVGEEDSATAVVVTAALNGAARGSATAVTVAVGKAGDSATEGTDYATVPDFTVTIGANATSGTGTFTLTPTQDPVSEGDETISVEGTATGLTVTAASLTLKDDEPAAASTAVTLSVDPTSVGEEDSATAVVVTAALNGAARGSATAVTVAVGDAADSATEGTDYATVSDFTVTIGASSTSGTGTFTLTPTQDVLDEGDERITVGGTATGLTVTAASLTLTDDDMASTAVTLSVDPASVGEEDSATAVVVTAALNGAARGSATAVTVAVGKAGDSATEGTDYATVPDFTVTIGANATSGTGTFTLTPTQDPVSEGDETISVEGTATGLTVTGASLTLKDDEPAAASTAVTLSVDPTSVGEADSATAVVVTAALNGAARGSATAVTVAVGDAADSATEGTDYATVSDFTVTIGASSTSGTGTFTLTPTQDVLDEGDERITVGGTATGLTVTAASLTLTDDDMASTAVTLSVDPASVGEEDSATAVVLTAALHGGARGEATAVTVAVGDAGDSATEGTDYATVSDFTVTIGAGATSGTGTFTLTPTQDTVSEGDESITVGGTATDLTVMGTSLTLTDDETASTGVTLSVNPASVGEADSATAVVLTAALHGGARGEATAVTVAVGAGTDSATEGTDYATVPDFTVTIGAGATSGTGTFTLTPTQDLLSEGDESITVGGTATDLTVMGTSLTLTDDETASTGVTLSVNPASVGEADSATAVVLTAALHGGARGEATAVTVAVGDAGDSATEGTDYATVSDFTVTIGAGATSGTGTFTLTPTQDLLSEGDETISVGGTATGLTVTGTSVTLEDDETAAATTAVTLSVNPRSVSEGAGPTMIAVTGTLGEPSAESNMVLIMVSGGTARAGPDFVPVDPFPLMIPAGSTSGMATFTLTPVEEAAVEPDETVVIDGDAVDTVVVSTEMRILDNDSADAPAEVLPEIRISDAAADEASGAINFRLSLSASVPRTVIVAWATDPRTAREGHDYIRIADTVTFPPGVTGATITVRLLDDRLDEIDETFQVLLYGASGATIADDIALGTIRDDDGPALTIEDATALETDGFISLRLVLSDPSPQLVVARWGTSAQTATPGADYTETSGITRISPGALSQTIVVEVLDDYIYEGEESFVVSLTDVDNAIPQGPGTAVIVDNELPPGIRIFDQRATESSGVLAFLVALDRPSELPITVERTTASRTATGDVDYVEALQLIEIAPGVTEVRSRVELIEDLLSEDDETFLAVLMSPTNAVVSDGEAVGTIEDDDPDPAMSVLDSRASEEAGQIVFRIELDASSGRTVTVDWSTAPGTAKPGSDYRDASGTVVLPPGKRVGEVRVDVINDRRDEPDETFQLVLSGAGNAEIARGTATGTIDDDDDAAPVLSAWLSRFGRTVTTQVAEAVGGRLNAPFGGSANMHLGLQPMYGSGVAIRPDLHGVGTRSRSAASYGFESVSTFDLLSRSSFFLPLATRSGQEPFGWTVWGRGSLMRFSGADTPVSVSGDVLTGLLGLDYRRGRTVAGVAVAHSRGQGNFEQLGMARSSARAGTMRSSLTSVNPYLGISLTDRVRFWGMFGTGVGEMQVDGDWNTSDLGMRAGVLGMRGVILEPTDPSGLRLAVETDAFVTKVDSTDDLRPRLIEADASRARVRLEAARRSGFSGGGALTPRVEVAARYDGGDAETGAGLEMASGVAFEHPGWRLMADWSGRMLILHQDAEYREWGMSGVIQIQPSLTGEGLQGSVRTGYGAQANGTGQLFSPLGNVFDTPLQAPIGRHWDSEMGYGFLVLRDALLVPYAGVASRSKEFPSFRFGFRMDVGTALNLDLELNRRQATDEPGVYGLFLRALVR